MHRVPHGDFTTEAPFCYFSPEFADIISLTSTPRGRGFCLFVCSSVLTGALFLGKADGSKSKGESERGDLILSDPKYWYFVTQIVPATCLGFQQFFVKEETVPSACRRTTPSIFHRRRPCPQRVAAQRLSSAIVKDEALTDRGCAHQHSVSPRSVKIESTHSSILC
jgi:hypothetical protein